MKNIKGSVSILIISILVVLLGVLGYIALKDNSLLKKEVSDNKIYSNSKIGISFNYPLAWGSIKEYVEKGCYNTKDIDCDNIVLTFTNVEKGQVSSASQAFVKNPNPRGGKISDTMFIKNQSVIDSYCAGKIKTNCQVYKNKNGITIAKISREKDCSEVGCIEASIAYYIKSNNTEFPGISFTAYPAAEKDFDEIVDSLAFIPSGQK